MTTLITVVDYGASNLLNVIRALEYCGVEAVLADTPDKIQDADKLVLPGVGSFKNAMSELNNQNLIPAIQAHAASGKALLGICLGMQMLLESSEEFGITSGLNLIPGKVKKIPETSMDNTLYKIPHIGWNELFYTEHACSESIISNVPQGSAVYFVHSYMVVPEDQKYIIAYCMYGGHRINAIVKKGSVVGCQFHPEKSGKYGLDMLRSFISMY